MIDSCSAVHGLSGTLAAFVLSLCSSFHFSNFVYLASGWGREPGMHKGGFYISGPEVAHVT